MDSEGAFYLSRRRFIKATVVGAGAAAIGAYAYGLTQDTIHENTAREALITHITQEQRRLMERYDIDVSFDPINLRNGTGSGKG